MDHSRTRESGNGHYTLPVFIRLITEARGMHHTHRLILFTLLRWADPEGRAWPSVESIAGACGMSRRSVQLGLRALEQDGVIITEGWANGGREHTTIRRIDPNRLAKKGAPHAPLEEIKGAIHDRKGRNLRAQRAQSTTIKGAPHAPELSKELPIELSKELQKPRACAREAAAAPEPEHEDPPERRNGQHTAGAVGSPRIAADALGGVWVPPDDPLRAHVGSELARVCGCSTSQITPMRVGEIVRALNGHASRNRDPTEWGGDSPYDPIRMATAALEVAAGATLNGRRGARAVAGVVGYAVAVIAENRGFGEYPEPITRTAPMSPGERKRAEFAEKLKAAQALREKRQ